MVFLFTNLVYGCGLLWCFWCLKIFRYPTSQLLVRKYKFLFLVGVTKSIRNNQNRKATEFKYQKNLVNSEIYKTWFYLTTSSYNWNGFSCSLTMKVIFVLVLPLTNPNITTAFLPCCIKLILWFYNYCPKKRPLFIFQFRPDLRTTRIRFSIQFVFWGVSQKESIPGPI